MLPYLLAIAGGYLIGSARKEGATIKFDEGGRIQFERDRNGSLYNRGLADSWYGRKRNPHWYPEGTYNGKPITKLTDKEIKEYNAGYDDMEKQGGKFAKGGVIKKVTDTDGTFYLTYIDSTHFYLSNTPDGGGMAYHIDQFRSRPFYKEVKTWLKNCYLGEQLKKDLNKFDES